jgi:hypothetical protein
MPHLERVTVQGGSDLGGRGHLQDPHLRALACPGPAAPGPAAPGPAATTAGRGTNSAASVASRTACISASTSSGGFGVRVSSGAATAARIFNGPGKLAGRASGAPETCRRTDTPGCRASGSSPTPAGPGTRSSSIGRPSAAPLA